MRYEVRMLASARRALRKLDKGVQARLTKAIDKLAENPRPHGCSKIKGVKNTYRIRVGDYRVLYEIRDKVLVVLVVEIGHRRGVYRDM